MRRIAASLIRPTLVYPIYTCCGCYVYCSSIHLKILFMDSPVSAISYLARAKELCKSQDKANLIYAALELRCGVEARLKEHASVAVGVSKRQANHYEIAKLSTTIENAFGLGDSMLIIFLQMEDGRECQFLYLPVNSQLQDIAKRLGAYLHSVPHQSTLDPGFWSDLKTMLAEGCGLLEFACQSELLRPTFDHGLHFCLPPDDPRIPILQDLKKGAKGAFTTATITPAGRLTYYPGNAGQQT